jgi:hypothetical protein
VNSLLPEAVQAIDRLKRARHLRGARARHATFNTLLTLRRVGAWTSRDRSRKIPAHRCRHQEAPMLAAWSARGSAVLASLFLAAAPAVAQGTAQERSACIGDAFRFCAADIPNVPKIEACLGSKQSQLTPACKAEFQPGQIRKTRLREEHFR